MVSLGSRRAQSASLNPFHQALLSASSASAFLFSAQKVQASSGLGTYLQEQHSWNVIDLDENVS